MSGIVAQETTSDLQSSSGSMVRQFPTTERSTRSQTKPFSTTDRNTRSQTKQITTKIIVTTQHHVTLVPTSRSQQQVPFTTSDRLPQWQTSKDFHTKPTPPQETFCYVIDLCIVISSSNKITNVDFSMLINFLLKLSSHLEVSKYCFNIAIVPSGGNPEDNLFFQQTTLDNVQDYITQMSLQQTEGYSLSGGIQYIRNHIFNNQQNQRKHAQKIALFIATEETLSTGLDINTVYQASQAKQSDIHIGVLVINNSISDASLSNNLALITSQPPSIFQIYTNTVNLLHFEVIQKVLGIFLHMTSQSTQRTNTIAGTTFTLRTSTEPNSQQSEDNTILITCK